MTQAWLIPVVAAISALLTGVFYRYALAYRVLDVPNARSAHTSPTPRGGGVAIVLSFLGAVLLLATWDAIEVHVAIALVGAGSLVALIGFLDDHRPLAVRWRLLTHLVAVIWGLAWIGGLGPVTLAGLTIEPGWAGQLLGTLCLMWLLNLYNFMDGIDGLAGLEAATVCAAAAVLSWWHAAGPDVRLLPALLAASSFGFLAWNWPPARIFMGDAGSGFLGLTLGLLAVRAGQVEPELFWAWMILLGVFIVDASVTLFRRLQRRQHPYQAHSDHGYQHAARQRAHRTVTLAVGAINLCWLAPIAVLVILGRLSGVAGLFLAYGPLVWLAVRLKSGTVVSSQTAVL